MSDIFSNVFYRFIKAIKENNIIKDNNEYTFHLDNYPEAKDLLEDIEINPNLFKVPSYIYITKSLLSVKSVIIRNINTYQPQIKLKGVVTVNPQDINSTLINVDIYPQNCYEMLDAEILDIVFNLILQTELENKEKVQNILVKQGFGAW